jgi:hypothetical protein
MRHADGGHENDGHEDNNQDRTPRLLRMLVFFSKYPELLTILLAVILFLLGLLFSVAWQWL